jgi:outer membrane lipoprotein SlyB
MLRILLCITLGTITLSSGCASSKSKPIIDPAGVDMAQYDTDVVECEQIATQVDQKAGAGAVEGAVIGGVLGAVFDNDVGEAAAAGAIIGGVKGGSSTEKEKSNVVKNCLRDRGYKILN